MKLTTKTLLKNLLVIFLFVLSIPVVGNILRSFNIHHFIFIKVSIILLCWVIYVSLLIFFLTLDFIKLKHDDKE